MRIESSFSRISENSMVRDVWASMTITPSRSAIILSTCSARASPAGHTMMSLSRAGGGRAETMAPLLASFSPMVRSTNRPSTVSLPPSTTISGFAGAFCSGSWTSFDPPPHEACSIKIERRRGIIRVCMDRTLPYLTHPRCWSTLSETTRGPS